MKKIVKTLLAASMMTGLAACSSGASANTNTTVGEDGTFYGAEILELDLSNADGVLAEVLDKGVLTIATSPDFPPQEYINEDGEVAGAEMKLAEYFATSLGVELVIEQMDFNAVLTAVDTGKVDLGMSGFGYKRDRAETFNISHGYVGTQEASCHGLLIPADKIDEYETVEDFAGLTIAAQASSLQEMYVEDQIPNAVIEKVSTLDQAILNIASGKVDAVALTCTSANNYAANSDGQFVKSTAEFDLTAYEQYAGNTAIAKKGEDSMTEVLNIMIDYINESGIYEVWYQEAKDDAGIE